MSTDDEEMLRHMQRLLAKVKAWRPLSRDEASSAISPLASTALAVTPPNEPEITAPKPGMVIRDSWELVAPLGKGGFGVVFEARHRGLERTDAIKLLHPYLADDDEIRRRFHDEAKTMAQLRGEHLVQVHDYGVHDGLPYFVMERLFGESLQSLIVRHAPLEEQGFFPLATGILRGVAEVHAHGIVHRDLKPGNIFVESGAQRVKILDFGLAKTSLHLTSHKLQMGTPVYMAPELLFDADARASVVTDIYSVGMVLYQLLAGRLPFQLDGRGHLGDLLQQRLGVTPAPPVVDGSAALQAVGELVLRALDRNPGRRPESAAAFLEALEAAARATDGTARRAANPPPERSPSDPHGPWLHRLHEAGPRLSHEPSGVGLPHFEATGPSYFYLSFSYHDEDALEPLVEAALSRRSLLWVGTGGRPSEVAEKPTREAIEGALGVVVIASPHAKRAASVAEEVTLALSMRKPVIPVWLRGTEWLECIDPRLQAAAAVDVRALGGERLGDELYRALSRCAGDMLPPRYTVSVVPPVPRTVRRGGMKEVVSSRPRRIPPPGYVFVEKPGGEDITRGLCLQLDAYRTMRELLDDVFLTLLVGRHPPFSYCEQWLLAQVSDSMHHPLVAVPWWWSQREGRGETLLQWGQETEPAAVGIDGRNHHWRVMSVPTNQHFVAVAGDDPRFLSEIGHFKGVAILRSQGVLELRAWEAFREAEHREKRCYLFPDDGLPRKTASVIVQTRPMPKRPSGVSHQELRRLREWMMATFRYGW